MRRILLLGFLIVVTTFSFAQRKGRYDTTYLRISDVQYSLSHATGWANQGNGKWVSDLNKIPFVLTEAEILTASRNVLDKKEGERRARRGKAHIDDKKLGRDNFDVMEIREVEIEGQIFKILIIKSKSVQYEFPMIREGLQTYDMLEYYVFDSEKVNELFPAQVKFGEPYMVSLDVFTNGKIPYWRTNDVEALISSKIQSSVYRSQMAGYSITNFIFALNPLVFQGKKVMRFYPVRAYNKEFVVKNYGYELNAKELFNHYYYEVDFDEFRSFIGPSRRTLSFDDEPTDFNGYFQRGIYLYDYGDYYRAIEYFDKALRIWPACDLFMIYALRANAEHKVGDYYDAIKDYNIALDLQPKSAEEYDTWVRSYFNRGVSKFCVGDVDEACTDWHKALEMGVEDALDLIKQHCK
ncbi:MAG: tetratricopeptide repeat protein [Bacteroidales bacterium]|nr:tetratricopeptide repeat protein [Bacteroidales bacterium]